MSTLFSTHQSTDAKSPSAIARIIRRICLLREQENATAAKQVEETELLSALRDYRLEFGADALPDTELREMYKAAACRVTEAVITAELLIPQLVGSLAASGPGRSRPLASAATEAPAPLSGATPPAAGSPAIADLLDAMLAAERTARRPLASAHR